MSFFLHLSSFCNKNATLLNACSFGIMCLFSYQNSADERSWYQLATLRLHLDSVHQATLTLWFVSLLSYVFICQNEADGFDQMDTYLNSRCFPHLSLSIHAAPCIWQNYLVLEANVFRDRKIRICACYSCSGVSEEMVSALSLHQILFLLDGDRRSVQSHGVEWLCVGTLKLFLELNIQGSFCRKTRLPGLQWMYAFL